MCVATCVAVDYLFRERLLHGQYEDKYWEGLLGVLSLNQVTVVLYLVNIFFSLTTFSLFFSPVFPLLRLVWSWDCWLPAKHQQSLSQTSTGQEHRRAWECTYEHKCRVRGCNHWGEMVWKARWCDCSWHLDLSSETNCWLSEAWN